VFGGDLYDKGPYDIRLSQMLCDLKDKHPDRVWLLMGNRDINKLRLSSELCTPQEMERLHDGNTQNHPVKHDIVKSFSLWRLKSSLLHYLLFCH